jgi:hypothetical protein
MKKLILTTVLALTILSFASAAALGNVFSFQAENGRLLPPAGLGLDLSTGYSPQGLSPYIDARLSYGLSSSVTIVGEFLKGKLADEKLAKIYFSPMHENSGYTVYLGYDLVRSEVPMYGFSFWLNNKLMYAFLNLGSDRNITGGDSFLITPGVNLKLGSKLRLGGEMEIKPGSFSCQELRLGGSYSLLKQIDVKFNVESGFGNNSGRVYSTGIAAEI